MGLEVFPWRFCGHLALILRTIFWLLRGRHPQGLGGIKRCVSSWHISLGYQQKLPPNAVKKVGLEIYGGDYHRSEHCFIAIEYFRVTLSVHSMNSWFCSSFY